MMELPQPDTHCHDDDTGLDVWSYSHGLVQSIVAAAIAEERKRWRAAARATVLAGARGVWSVDLAFALRDLAVVHDDSTLPLTASRTQEG